MKRRTFLDQSSLGVTSLLIAPHVLSCAPKAETQAVTGKSTPYVISTWNVAQANTIAGKALEEGANSLDAAVAGVPGARSVCSDCISQACRAAERLFTAC